jgi:hypothetical protein
MGAVTLLVEITLVVAAAVGVAAGVAGLPRASPRGRAPRVSASPVIPAQLLAIERLVSNSRVNAVHVHAYLRPVLAEVADQRLTARGRSLPRLSEPAGRRLLGDELWEIIRPERPFPEDRYGPGLSLPQLDAMLGRLEAL